MKHVQSYLRSTKIFGIYCYICFSVLQCTNLNSIYFNVHYSVDLVIVNISFVWQVCPSCGASPSNLHNEKDDLLKMLFNDSSIKLFLIGPLIIDASFVSMMGILSTSVVIVICWGNNFFFTGALGVHTVCDQNCCSLSDSVIRIAYLLLQIFVISRENLFFYYFH